MLHDDSVKAYIRPCGSEREDDGFKEYLLPLTDGDNDRLKKCLIDHSEDLVELFLQFPPVFNFHGATAVHMGLSCGVNRYRKDAQGLRMQYWTGHVRNLIKEPHVLGRIKRVRLPDIGKDLSKLRALTNSNPNILTNIRIGAAPSTTVLTEGEYDRNADPECISLCYQLGHAEWIDKKYVLIKETKTLNVSESQVLTAHSDATLNGAHQNVNYRGRKFKRLAIQHGTSATGENERSPFPAGLSDHGGQRETSTQTSTLRSPAHQQTDGINDPQAVALQAPGHASSARQSSEISTHIASPRTLLQSRTTSAKRPAPHASQEFTDPNKRPHKEEEEEKDGPFRQFPLALEFAEKDENALREELEDVQLQESELRLNRRRIFIQRQLARKLREQGTPSKPIKIEDDE